MRTEMADDRGESEEPGRWKSEFREEDPPSNLHPPFSEDHGRFDALIDEASFRPDSFGPRCSKPPHRKRLFLSTFFHLRVWPKKKKKKKKKKKLLHLRPYGYGTNLNPPEGTGPGSNETTAVRSENFESARIGDLPLAASPRRPPRHWFASANYRCNSTGVEFPVIPPKETASPPALRDELAADRNLLTRKSEARSACRDSPPVLRQNSKSAVERIFSIDKSIQPAILAIEPRRGIFIRTSYRRNSLNGFHVRANNGRRDSVTVDYTFSRVARTTLSSGHDFSAFASRALTLGARDLRKKKKKEKRGRACVNTERSAMKQRRAVGGKSAWSSARSGRRGEGAKDVADSSRGRAGERGSSIIDRALTRLSEDRSTGASP
ncbi:hypothetical protein KM043_007383 [Ampulex compressa]|nr:hypothetical protein KM043_007383 [Ampulex compressa]